MIKVIPLPVIKPGRYVVAVSGGVDSMVLLDVLRKQSNLELIVAHFDHGIRKNSISDQQFVQHAVMSHNITFEYAKGHLGPDASEAKARQARYNFLRHICKKHNALAVIMAHHQDDLLETAIINLLRGTGRRGLNALRSHNKLLRPFLHLPKATLVNYAAEHGLDWCEDSTNTDLTYVRNYVRHKILIKFNNRQRRKLLQIIVRQSNINQAIDLQLEQWLKQFGLYPSYNPPLLPRYQLIMLPPAVAYEILQYLCKVVTGSTLEKPLANKALLFAKTAWPGKCFMLHGTWQLRVTKRQVIVEPREPVIS